MIPKKIHYCWFGENEMPIEYKLYIDEWKQLHPAWEIIKWDEKNTNLDIPYIQKSLKMKNYANVSNLVRLLVLKDMGGIYLDTDIKTIKPLDDFLLHDCFLGFESGDISSDDFYVNNAVIGSIPDHFFINFCINELIANFDGSEMANASAPVLLTRVLKINFGLKQYGEQEINGIKIYPIETFYPVRGFESYKSKKNNLTINYPKSYTIHTWGRSWYSKEMFLNDIEVLQELTVNQKIEIDQKTLELNRVKNQLKIEAPEIDSLKVINKILQEYFDKANEAEINSNRLEIANATLFDENKLLKDELRLKIDEVLSLKKKIDELKSKLKRKESLIEKLEFKLENFVQKSIEIQEEFKKIKEKNNGK